jgi:hypothetical protein
MVGALRSRVNISEVVGGLAYCVVVFTGIAGLLKLMDIPAFAASLESWTLIGSGLRDIITWGLPTAELWLCVLWLATPRSRTANVSFIALFAGIVFTIVAHLTAGHAPRCGCLGALSAHSEFMSSSGSLLAKASLFWSVMVLHYIMAMNRPLARDGCEDMSKSVQGH